MLEKIQQRLSQFDYVDFLRHLFPITLWLPHYNLQKLRGDVIAGITVGIMIIPQSLAFATLAGIPLQYGLYTALSPGIVYCIFGTSKDVSMGPTVTMALFTYRYNSTFSTVGSSLLAFFVGIILILMAILKLGFVTKFVPSHVISGFISSAAIVIATTQLKNLSGHKNTPSSFVGKIIHFFKNIKYTNTWDITLGLFSLAFLIFFMWVSKKQLSKTTEKKKSTCRTYCLNGVWFVCVAKSALVCIIGTIVAYVFYTYGYTDSFTLAGNLQKGLPSFQVCKFPCVYIINSAKQTIWFPEHDHVMEL